MYGTTGGTYSSRFLRPVMVCSLVDTITSMGNPFWEDRPKLVVMDMRDCADKSVVTTVRTIEERGRALYDKFVQDVIKE